MLYYNLILTKTKKEEKMKVYALCSIKHFTEKIEEVFYLFFSKEKADKKMDELYSYLFNGEFHDFLTCFYYEVREIKLFEIPELSGVQKENNPLPEMPAEKKIRKEIKKIKEMVPEEYLEIICDYLEFENSIEEDEYLLS